MLFLSFFNRRFDTPPSILSGEILNQSLMTSFKDKPPTGTYSDYDVPNVSSQRVQIFRPDLSDIRCTCTITILPECLVWSYSITFEDVSKEI